MRRLPALATIVLVSACTTRSGMPALPPPSQSLLHAAASRLTADGVLYVANELGNSIYVYKVGGSIPLRKITKGIDQPLAVAVDGSGNLYVGNQGHGRLPEGSVTVYAPGSDTPARTITDGINQLAALALDPAGDVFVVNYRAYAVYEYAAGTTKIERTITDGIFSPTRLAVDASGYLYVSNCQACIYETTHDTITIYRPENEKLFLTIHTTGDAPGELDFDRRGSLFVNLGSNIDVYERRSKKLLRKIVGAAGTFCFDANDNLYSGQDRYINYGGRVLVYRPGAQKPAYTITEGAFDPSAVAVDAVGDLYVTNPARNIVSVYRPGSARLSRTIVVVTGLDDPTAIALDGAGNIYAANTYESSVTVYAPGSKQVLRTISDSVISPSALAFDAVGNLYVANSYGNGGGSDPNGSITVYAPGKSKPQLKISQGLHGATYALAFDGAQNLYVASGCPQNGEPITVYPPGKRVPSRTIGRPGINPCAIALDSRGNLYAAVVGLPGEVSVFAPSDSDPKYQITQGIDYPEGLALDAAGDLYVTNGYGGGGKHWGSVSIYHSGKQRPFRRIKPLTHGNGPGDPVLGPSSELYVVAGQEILVFAPGGDKVVRRIRKGLAFPTALTFDGSGILYVANPANSTITEYAPGSVDVLRTIPGVKAYPYAIALGP
jgi:sugar lactone lactonase YvrE